MKEVDIHEIIELIEWPGCGFTYRWTMEKSIVRIWRVHVSGLEELHFEATIRKLENEFDFEKHMEDV